MPAHIDLFATARELVNQPPPPSLREILSAYRAKGDGDRDMLLAMLNAKTAEEQSHSNRAALCRTLIEAQQHISYPPSPPMHHDYYLPTPSALVHSPPHSSRDAPLPKRNHYHHRGHSPYTLAPMSESRKRLRASQSPPRDREPPSPVSTSSSITDSPRSARPSMAIGLYSPLG
ncbi:hypothetical protein BDZ89DRAFT_1061813 [Hymenopellis radicata]|nr:hypothetical protein BDZ89DRAFT_1061813 [Hymenopellis radicata]